MALTSGFFNSINDDRPYDSEQMSHIFDGIIRDGVYETIGDRFRITPGEGLQVMVGTGRAWFDHTWTENDTAFPIDLDNSEVGLNRIDLIVLEVNYSEETRANSIKCITGTPAEHPVRPEPTKETAVIQYPLAAVYVGAGSSALSTSDITNYVGTEECPFVIGVLEIMTIDQITAQWESQWHDEIITREEAMDAWTAAQKAELLAWIDGFEDEANDWKSDWKQALLAWEADEKADFDNWFQHLHNELDENQAAHLQNQIDAIKSIPESELDSILYRVYGRN